MTQYADYKFYKDEYKGIMPEADFNRLSILASQKIKMNTFNRIDENNVQKEVKWCVCVLADKLLNLEKTENKSSESVGSWSITFANSQDGKQVILDTLKDMLSEVVDKNGTPLLYRGC